MTPKPSLLRDRAYDRIKRAIILGEFGPGTMLYESAVARTLEMSRTPVREALMRLAEEGLVRNFPNAGRLVAVPTLKEIEEIFDLRLCLESYVVSEIFSRNISFRLEPLSTWIDAQEKALREEAPWKFFEANHQFHIELVRLLGNQTLVDVVQGLHDKPIQSGFQALRNNASLFEPIVEHRDIVRALEEPGPEAALAEITRHATNSRKRLLGMKTRS